MRVVVDYDVDRLQVYNGDIKPSSTNCPKSFSKKIAIRDSIAELQLLSKIAIRDLIAELQTLLKGYTSRLDC